LPIDCNIPCICTEVIFGLPAQPPTPLLVAGAAGLAGEAAAGEAAAGRAGAEAGAEAGEVAGEGTAGAELIPAMGAMGSSSSSQASSSAPMPGMPLMPPSAPGRIKPTMFTPGKEGILLGRVPFFM